MGRRRLNVSSSTYPCLTQSGVSPRLTVWLVAVVQMIPVRRCFGGSTKRDKPFVVPMQQGNVKRTKRHDVERVEAGTAG